VNQRIEAFLADVLALAGENPGRSAGGCGSPSPSARRFRLQEPKNRMRDQAARACRALCRARVAEELQRRRGTRIAEHLKLVLSSQMSSRRFPPPWTAEEPTPASSLATPAGRRSPTCISKRSRDGRAATSGLVPGEQLGRNRSPASGSGSLAMFAAIGASWTTCARTATTGARKLRRRSGS
jgi:hypothetical protein